MIFLSDGTMDSFLCFTALCCVAQAKHISITYIERNDTNFHKKFYASLMTDGAVRVWCPAQTFRDTLTDNEQEFIPHPGISLQSIFNEYEDVFTPNMETFLLFLDGQHELYLPFVIAYMAVRELGAIDAANHIAHRLLTLNRYYITRDAELIELIHPIVRDSDVYMP